MAFLKSRNWGMLLVAIFLIVYAVVALLPRLGATVPHADLVVAAVAAVAGICLLLGK